MNNLKTNNMDIVRPYNIKSLEDESVKQYLKWAVKYKSLETIRDEINLSLAPRAKKVTADEVAKYYIELQQKSEELTKEQVHKMITSYLESENAFKCSDYKWLQKHSYIMEEWLFKLKNPSVYGISTAIFKTYNKVIATRCIAKHFRKIGIYLPLGSRQIAIQRCGTYYRKKLERLENKYTSKKQKANKQ